METLQTLPPDEDDDFLPVQQPNGLVAHEEGEGEGEDVYVDEEEDDEDEDEVEEEEEEAEEGGVERTYGSVQERMRCVEMSAVCAMSVLSSLLLLLLLLLFLLLILLLLLLLILLLLLLLLCSDQGSPRDLQIRADVSSDTLGYYPPMTAQGAYTVSINYPHAE